jgi:hypothetical protein
MPRPCEKQRLAYLCNLHNPSFEVPIVTRMSAATTAYSAGMQSYIDIMIECVSFTKYQIINFSMNSSNLAAMTQLTSPAPNVGEDNYTIICPKFQASNSYNTISVMGFGHIN